MLKDDPKIAKIARSVCRRLGLVLVGFVGKGAYKYVYEVSNKNDERMALKIMSGNLIDEKRLKREIELLKSCDHRYICNIISFGKSQDGRPYILEEFIGGGDLDKYVVNNGLVSDDEVGKLMLAMGEAIKFLDSKSIVHRDIKPANIFLRESGFVPVLGDFGLARGIDDTSLTATWQNQGPGTPEYASPEQLTNDRSMINWRSDQFSLGVTVSYVKFGIHPYGVQAVDLLREKIFATTCGEFRAQCKGSVFGDVLAKMVNYWPHQRYTRVDGLIGDIQKSLKEVK